MIDGPRACRPEEFEETIALINATFRANSTQDIRTDYPLIFNHDNLEHMRILKVDDQVVAHVPVAPRRVIAGDDTFTVGIISPTVTHPDYRHKGYATLCLRDNVRRMQENGWPLSVLWTVEATFPFYQNSGWEAVGNQGWVYDLRPRDEALFAGGDYETVRFDRDSDLHLDAVMAFHEAERHRIARTRQEYATLLTLPRIETLLAVEDARIAGYLCVGSGSNKPGVIEAGGLPRAVESLLVEVLRNRDEDIQAVSNLTPTTLDDLLVARVLDSRRPMENAAGIGPQMLRINNLGLLLRQMTAHLGARSAGLSDAISLECEETGEAITLSFEDGEVDFSVGSTAKRIALNQRQWVQMIFGAHPIHEPTVIPGAPGELLDRLFPFYFPVWELDHS
jgi:GNAT superfamily N-acetyltransferase